MVVTARYFSLSLSFVVVVVVEMKHMYIEGMHNLATKAFRNMFNMTAAPNVLKWSVR